jgi:hypothetical protein
MDNLGDPLTFMMKAGDDLRQDQLTVQMFRIMDRLWLAAGLDLKMSPYVVLDAGAETGMIEVVPHAATSAAIQKEYGGVKAAFSEKPLLEWLKKHNPNEADLRHAILITVASWATQRSLLECPETEPHSCSLLSSCTLWEVLVVISSSNLLSFAAKLTMFYERTQTFSSIFSR